MEEKKKEKLITSIDAKVKAKLIEIADSYGMTLSGLVAYVLGTYVKSQERLNDADVMEKMAEVLKVVVKPPSEVKRR